MNVTDRRNTEFYKDTDEETVLYVDWSSHGRWVGSVYLYFYKTDLLYSDSDFCHDAIYHGMAALAYL